MPIATGAGHSDLAATRVLQVGGDEDQREIGVAVVLLEVRLRGADGMSESAVIVFVHVLILKHDRAMHVEQAQHLCLFGTRDLFGVDATNAAINVQLFSSHSSIPLGREMISLRVACRCTLRHMGRVFAS